MPSTSSSNTLFVSLIMRGQVCSGPCQSAEEAWLPLAAFGFLQDQMAVFSLYKDLKTERKCSGRLCKIIQALDVTEDGRKFFPISHCLKGELKSSLAWAAPAGCPRALLSRLPICTFRLFSGS